MGEQTDIERTAPENAHSGLKFALEFGPLALFFVCFQIFGIMVATGAFMAAMLLSVIISHRVQGHVSKMLWLNLALVLVAGGLTLALKDDSFIKMKPTLLFGAFAVLLAGGLVLRRLFLKSLMGSMLPDLPDKAWRRLTLGFIVLYGLAATANEISRTVFTTDGWVSFKFYALIPSLMLGTLVLFAVVLGPYQCEDGRDQNTDSTSDNEGSS